jgi:hypothetical protein
MSVFDDLIDELKNEQLLEDAGVARKPGTASISSRGEAVESSASAGKPNSGVAMAPSGDPEMLSIKPHADGREFFRKRAMEEVSSLQMVEHVFSTIERVHLGITPSTFGDLKVKTALHKLLQSSEDADPVEDTEAEYELRQECEAWNFHHYERDQNISRSNLRRFCEDSRPVLSSQALISLARFYRNSPFSEEVRGKFEYIVTRLFSMVDDEQFRHLLLSTEETVCQINTLYANWSSIVMFTNEEAHAEVRLALSRLSELVEEALNTGSIGEMSVSGVFGRISGLKEEIAELFYVPEVTAAAIQANLLVGNHLIKLIRKGLSAAKEAELSAIGPDLENAASDALARDLVIARLMVPTEETETPDTPAPVAVPAKQKPAKMAPAKPTAEVRQFDLFAVNRWILAATVLSILVSVGLYVWAEKFAGGGEVDVKVSSSVEVGDDEIRKFVRSPRQSQETFYAIVEPTFAALSADEQKALLARVQQFAISKGMNKVNLVDESGRSVAFASKNRLDLVQK